MQKNCAERIKAEGKTKPGGASKTERGGGGGGGGAKWDCSHVMYLE